MNILKFTQRDGTIVRVKASQGKWNNNNIRKIYAEAVRRGWTHRRLKYLQEQR